MSMGVVGVARRFPYRFFRIAFASLAAGPLGAVIYSAVWMLPMDSGVENVPDFLSRIPSLIWIAVWGAIIGWPAIALGGLPLHTLFYKLGWRSIWPYIPAGAIVGSVAALVWALLALRALPTPTGGIASMGAIVGAVSGFIFWLIRRPDQDQKERGLPA